jgi:hypothetical protein
MLKGRHIGYMDIRDEYKFLQWPVGLFALDPNRTRLKFLISHNPRGNTVITLKSKSVSHI